MFTFFFVYIHKSEYIHVRDYIQAIAALNHGGICLSYDMTWTYLKRLSEEADYQGQVKEGHWLWVYDNFNYHQTTRHERQGKSFVLFIVSQ